MQTLEIYDYEWTFKKVTNLHNNMLLAKSFFKCNGVCGYKRNKGKQPAEFWFILGSMPANSTLVLLLTQTRQFGMVNP